MFCCNPWMLQTKGFTPGTVQWLEHAKHVIQWLELLEHIGMLELAEHEVVALLQVPGYFSPLLEVQCGHQFGHNCISSQNGVMGGFNFTGFDVTPGNPAKTDRGGIHHFNEFDRFGLGDGTACI